MVGRHNTLAKLLRWLFPETMATECRHAHEEGYTLGQADGFASGKDYGMSLVPGHARKVQANLDACSADRARLTRQIVALGGTPSP